MSTPHRAFAVTFTFLLAAACTKRDGAPSTPPGATSTSASTRTPPAPWEPDRSCTSNDECAPAPSCCPVPCSSLVINRKDLAQAQARVSAECSAEKRAACPQAGSCAGHLYACVRTKCALVLEGSPDWPKDAAAR